MVVDSNSDDIIYSKLFTGVLGNYLKGSVRNVGLDPDTLPDSDVGAMSFSDGNSKPKAWKEIWGSGQGIGAIKEIVPARVLIERLQQEYRVARERLQLAPALLPLQQGERRTTRY